MLAATPAQMREIDRLSIERFGIPGIVLMENAAIRVVEEIEKMLGGCKGKTAAVFAGKGNNGGDAYAVARHLFNRGADIRVYSLFDDGGLPPDALTNLGIIRRLGVGEELFVPEDSEDRINGADIIVDGIFGTGFRGDVEGPAARAVEAINKRGKNIISIDTPSGLDCLTGRAGGICVRADVTIALGLLKVGMLLYPGCEYCGRVVVADIGLPAEAVELAGIKTFLIDREMVSGIIPARREASNKGDYGKILIVAGSKGMTGAGGLCSRAALRTGAGLVYVAAPESLTEVLDQTVPEAVILPLEDNGEGVVAAGAAAGLASLLQGKDAVAAGPGLSTGEGVPEAVKALLETSPAPMVLDADALNVLSKEVSLLGGLKAPAVLTPHPGEMARLTGKTIDEVQRDRIGTASEFSRRWKVVTVLKGAHTVVAFPDGRAFVNPTGNSGMATGGTGDVLTGIIAGLLGQGAEAGQAAMAGVFIHGLAGDSAASDKGRHGLIAGDVVERLPYVIKELTAAD